MKRDIPRWFTFNDPAQVIKHETKSVQDLKQLWESQHKQFLNNVLSIYQYNFLEFAINYVYKIWQSTKFSKINNSAKLIVSSNVPYKSIIDHLVYRHPIHINGPQYSDINLKRLKLFMGLTRDLISNIQNDSNIKYGIIAQTPILQHSQSIQQRKVWILHTWGVNLESRFTTDANYVFSSGSFSSRKYLHLLQNMFDIIENGCIYVHSKTKKNIVLRITKLGFGAWINEMPKKLIPVMASKYEEWLLDLQSRHFWLQIRHPRNPTHTTVTPINNTWIVAENNHDIFGKPKNVIDPNYIPIDKNSELIIVNAWDDRSFIGNGGSRDFSIDGYMVAGGSNTFPKSEFNMPMGKNMINASYLHNPFFCTNLLDEENWIRF